jgi:hypothetical protein
MLSEAKVGPGGWPYYFRSVMVGDGHRPAGKPLRAAQDEAGVPPGVWTGRGLAAVGLTAGAVVTERQAELLLGEGRHPDADRIERERLEAGDAPAKARRATVLGRPIEHNQSPETEKGKERSPWLAMDLVFRAPSTAQIAWALLGEEHRLVLELCQDIARDKVLAWLEESVAQIRWRSGGKHREPIRDGLIGAVFRHYESRAVESKPLLHDHAVVSIRARRPDAKKTWGNLSADSMLEHIVAAGTLYSVCFREREVSARLGWAWEPREVTPCCPSSWPTTKSGRGTRRGSGPPTRWAGKPQTGRARRSARCRGRCPNCARYGGPQRSGRSAPAPSTGLRSGRGRWPRRCGCGRWSTSPWRPSTPSPWCT